MQDFDLLDRTNINISQYDQRFYQRILLIDILSFSISLTLIVLFWALGYTGEPILYLCLLSSSYVVIYFVCRAGKVRAGFYALFYQTCLACLLGLVLLGWKSGMFLYVFILLPTFMVSNLLKKKELLALLAFYFFVIATSLYISFNFQPLIVIDPVEMQILSTVSGFLVGFMLAGGVYLDQKSAATISHSLVEANEQLAYLASRDPLTSLVNRRRMNELIEMEHVRSKRSCKPLGLIMVDVDDFKRVNDTYGHPAGDFVLVQISKILSSSLRKQDVVSRWGGEEFLILLPETDMAGTIVAAEKTRDIIAHTSFSYLGSMIQVTATFGGVTCEPSEDWDDAVKKADKALYLGKNSGKNVTISSKAGVSRVSERAEGYS